MSAPLANNPPSFSEPAPASVATPPLGRVFDPEAQTRRELGAERQAAGAEELAAAPRPHLGRMFAEWMTSSGCWAWLSSAAVHAVALILLSLVILAVPKEEEKLWVSGAFDAMPAQDMEMDLGEVPLDGETPSLGPIERGDEFSIPGERQATIGSATGTNPRTSTGAGAGSALGGEFAPKISSPLAELAPASVAAGGGGFESLDNPLASRGGGLDGRTLENRRGLALSGGGTAQSEAAVEAALVWLAEHQWPDGGWRFDLKNCPNCNGYCRNPGSHTSSTAATGLALLSFLGAGYTHEEGKYQTVVQQGLYFLNSKMTVTSHGGDLRDQGADLEMAVPRSNLLNGLDLTLARRDSMYSHGIASLAITEAYAMTRDSGMRPQAEAAVKFVVSAQYADGGWRYNPGFEGPGPGDMTVSGWQIAVLKSATLAGIDVPYDVWMKIAEFLDGIQDEGGSTYLYLRGERGTPATTAIGLLCRMICGWPREHSPLQRGAAKLGAQLPNRNNMYFNYYASQVLHHMGGAHWEKWNPKMREYLVKTQATEGHEAGSWYFEEAHSGQGGRLYTTAMATMTLEVYYRYMPLYKEAFVDQAR